MTVLCRCGKQLRWQPPAGRSAGYWYHPGRSPQVFCHPFTGPDDWNLPSSVRLMRATPAVQGDWTRPVHPARPAAAVASAVDRGRLPLPIGD